MNSGALRSRLLCKLLGVACVLATATIARAGDGPGTVASPYEVANLVTHRLNEKLYVIEATGLSIRDLAGNIAVLTGEDGVLIVDDQFLPLAGRIKKAISELSSEPVRWVLNTHAHKDHTDGNPAFGGRGGATIIAHRHARNFLIRSHDVEVKALNTTVHLPAMDPAGWPKITFDNSIEVHVNGETVRILYLGPAHTNGDVIVQFVESNVIHMGDLYVQYGLPWIDLYGGGDAAGLGGVYELAYQLSDENTHIIPGHGTVVGRDEMLATGLKIRLIIERIQQGIDAGKSLEAIQAEKPARDFVNNGPVTDEIFVADAYNSLVGAGRE